MKSTLLIVENEIDLLRGLKRSIASETEYEILTAENGVQAFDIISKTPIDLVLTDINMPEMDGMTLLKKIVQFDPSITVLMMTAFGTIDIAIEALKEGAYDFVQKPFEMDTLLRLINKGIERNHLVRENKLLMSQVCKSLPFENMMGKSAPIQKIFETIQMLGKSDVTVLVTGETGTGKDLTAQAIHDCSARRNKDLITVNCPALPEGLLESELFGHKKGSFTSAHENKTGLFDQAEGSTIFLDEIGDLPLSLQTKLLRVLQNRELKPVGSDKSHKINVRVVAATNQNLNQKIENGQFRADLYYRLNVASIKMPSLKQIKADIPIFIDHFLRKSACELSIEPKQVTPEVVEYFSSQNWPGNIRELENSIQGICAMTEGHMITLDHILGVSHEDSITRAEDEFSIPYKALKEKMIEKFTKSYISRLLKQTGGNMTTSAEISGIKRQSLQKIVNRYNIDVSLFRE